MAILKKPYTLAVYDDILQSDGSFAEERICIIGSDKMQSQSRALEPNLIRNVNGQNKFSFKMYKKYIDITTGEKIENPFTEWLVSERKVKLHYDGKWYDFVIKDIAENSSNYLYTYSLEDANVQELSKNGFGVTLDAELMNNIGSAEELGKYVMEETDWAVEESDVSVQTVDEALVYVTLPNDFGSGENEIKIYRLIDQTKDDLDEGVEPQEVTGTAKNNLKNQTILAFYSSCKNKPHRFQFIYANNGDYDKNDKEYAISRKDDRTINEKDCQYYIDFNNPETAYSVHNTTYDIYLPTGFQVSQDVGVDVRDNSEEQDTVLSTWYRGARYGFSQQAIYVPLLERYCQKFKTETQDIQISEDTITWFDNGNSNILKDETQDYTNNIFTCTKRQYGGLKINIDYQNHEVYKVSYLVESLPNSAGGIAPPLKTIGGHHDSFEISKFTIRNGGENGQEIIPVGLTSMDRAYIIYNPGAEEGKRGTWATKVWVEAYYNKVNLNNSTDGWPHIYIQPNRDIAEESKVQISNIKVERLQEYYGYTDTEYISPTLIQNCITNYNFKSNSGWTATQTTKGSSNTKPSAEGVYGRFVNNKFKSIIDDYFDGSYHDTNTYKSYMKIEFKANNQFVLNSGIRDNRSIIKNMPVGEEWVLDYKIVDKNNDDVTSQFGVEIKEFIYNKDSGAYSERSGSISLTSRAPTETETIDLSTDLTRKIFTVNTNNYTEDQFKGKNGANGTYLQLQIIPPTYTTDDKGNIEPVVYYIEHIALYRKSLDKNGEIIVPDYEAEESAAAQNYVDSSTLEYKYNYFNAWHVDSANPKKCADKEALPLHTSTTLKYDTYKPLYNEGAKKIRSVSVRESNYFNILQSIAETFEQWLIININRDSETGAIVPEYNQDGSIRNLGKKISFKNYRGDNNYACFRYGVNLKDIQRTYTSKNIVTKLLVKANSNQFGKDGFCTIQRASANPTGENYIYDFQYYQNTGLMDVNNYLTTNYYLDDAVGNDAALWTGEITAPSGTQQTNINGYFPRLKKINDAILPLNEEVIGLSADLVQEEAKKEVAEAQKEAALDGIEQTRLDFHALTGVYPEDAQDNAITSIIDDSIVVTPQDDWYTDKNWSYNPTDKTVSITLSAIGNDTQVTPRDIVLTQGTTEVSKSGGKYRVKSHEWDGLYVDYAYENGITYLLSYDLEIVKPETTDPPTLKNIGCHNTSFVDNFKITVKGINNSIDTNSDSSICAISSTPTEGKFHVSVKGTFNSGAAENSKPCLYIQPNRGENTSEIEYVVSNIKLYEVGTNNSAPNHDRSVSVYVKAKLNIEGYNNSIERTIEVKGKIPAESNTATLTAQFTVIDMSRSDVQKYIQELTTYRQSHQDAENTLTEVGPIIAAKQNAIDIKNQLREQYLSWKKELNKLFFQRYCRFIQEGTWINEEYVDDEKYYADAQSVMYNSCYPQVAYTINVLELSQLPGYELFKFDLGDKTQVIDDEFFGEGYREEVVITELSEMLDDPSKNTIKVQNFKNQFQDLFQKITATVQQTQYNVGSYEKGAAFLQASEQKKSEFITNAINNAKSYLSAGQTVESGPAGITITDDSDKKRQLRLVGGAILFSAEDPETKETKWRTGLTNEGISADLITAGRLDIGAVQIMSGDDPVFRWDAYGISAYDARWDDSLGTSIIDSINTNKFVRFDKHGIYGINSTAIDGQTWHPDNIEQIDEKATFALTWEGLKVSQPLTNGKYATARIGNYTDEQGNKSIIKINDGALDTLLVDAQGKLIVRGRIMADQGTIGGENGWNIGTSKLWSGGTESSPILYLGLEAIAAQIGGASPDVVFKAGNQFGVTSDGVLYCNNIQLTGGNISGWGINANGFTRGAIGTDGFHMYSQNYPSGKYFQAEESQYWALAIGDKVGVTKDGALYCAALRIKTDYRQSGSSNFGVCFLSQSSRITFLGHFEDRDNNNITSNPSIYWSVKQGRKRVWMGDSLLMNEAEDWELGYLKVRNDYGEHEYGYVSVKDLYNLVQYAQDQGWIPKN